MPDKCCDCWFLFFYIASGNSLVQNENVHLVQNINSIEDTVYNSQINWGSAAKCASNFTASGSVKIKLQLFPADEHTRSGLEKVFDLLICFEI